MTFGITRDSLPLNDEGKLRPDKFAAFLEERKSIEQQRKIANAAVPPADYAIKFPLSVDVLLGRGRYVAGDFIWIRVQSTQSYIKLAAS